MKKRKHWWIAVERETGTAYPYRVFPNRKRARQFIRFRWWSTVKLDAVKVVHAAKPRTVGPPIPPPIPPWTDTGKHIF